VQVTKHQFSFCGKNYTLVNIADVSSQVLFDKAETEKKLLA